MKPTLILAAALAAPLLTGCATAQGQYAPGDSMKYSIANTGRFLLLDRPTSNSVTCTGLQERVLPDGRIEVIANVKNKESRRIQVQINCVFKDANGVPTGDETPFRTLILTGNATEAVHFLAMNTAAKDYTIRVRQVR